EPPWVRAVLIALAFAFLAAFLVLPLVSVFVEAFGRGAAYYLTSVSDPVALSAIRLTLFTTAVVVPLNIVFGLAASWAITRFEFPGKTLLITLIDMPFSVSPVISGMIYV